MSGEFTPGRIAAQAHDRSLFGDETPVPWGQPDSPAVVAWEAAAEAIAAPLRAEIGRLLEALRMASDAGDATAAAKPVLVTWDPGEATSTHVEEIAAAVRDQSGGRVIITMTDIPDSDCHAVIGPRAYTDDEALALLDTEAGDPQ